MAGKHKSGEATSASIMRVRLPESQMVEQWYIFRNQAEVLGFLEEHPFLMSVLSDAHDKIAKYFPHSRLFAEIMVEPDETDGAELVVSVATDLAPVEALDRLEQFDKDWWLNALEQAQGKLCINLEFV